MTSKLYAIALLGAFSLPGYAARQPADVGQRCLNYGIQVMKDNPEAARLLKLARTDNASLTENRFAGYIGKQYIASEVAVKIRNQQQELGEILCLFTDDQPLYFHYSPFN